jgi:hypothetical protein
MTANTSLNVADLNFQSIKNNLKAFLRQQPIFTDYDFEDSTLSKVLDVLAYNSYYQNFYLNMIGNEMFLDSALQRENVVSAAKPLGYLPRSVRASRATLSVAFVPNDSPDVIIIPAYTLFTASTNNNTYKFTTDQDYVVPNNGTYVKTIDIFEGEVLTYTWTYSTQKVFELPNPNLDATSLRVYVKPNASSSTKTEYKFVQNVIDIQATSNVYYLQENAKGNYDIYFGDGVLGAPLQPGNVVIVTGRFATGAATNGLTGFVNSGTVGFNKNDITKTYSPTALAITSVAVDGQDREDIESVRFLAPKRFGIQNRLVVADDYRTYIMSQFGDIASIALWGGEDNDPPIYGKCLVSAKPKSGFVLTNSKKSEIATAVSKLNVMSIDPLFIDPIFTFINPVITVHYDPSLTVLTSDALYEKTATTVTLYEQNHLGVFGSSFYESRLTALIDQTDNSFLNTDLTIQIEKRITPIFNSVVTYKILLHAPLYHPYDGYLGCVSTEGFTQASSDKVCFFDDNGFGIIRMFYKSGNTKVYLNRNAGTVDYSTGTILLKSIGFQSVASTQINDLRIFAAPQNSSYTPLRNEILLLSFPRINMFDVNLDLTLTSKIVDVLGNTTPIQNNGVLTTVVL